MMIGNPFQRPMQWTRQRVFTALRRMASVKKHSICEQCGDALQETHEHLFDIAARQAKCCCQSCAARQEHVLQPTLRRLPKHVEALTIQISDTQWEKLGIPIALTFFLKSYPLQKIIALYPSPAGPLESQVEASAWSELERSNPIIREMDWEVEALLVNRLRGKKVYFRIPLDRAFELVGKIRMYWQGFSGGEKVWNEIDQFFERLDLIATSSNAPQPASSLNV